LRPCPKDAYLLENYKNIIGKKTKRKIKSGDYIKKSDFR
jgi:sialic acid synthase SpsE